MCTIDGENKGRNQEVYSAGHAFRQRVLSLLCLVWCGTLKRERKRSRAAQTGREACEERELLKTAGLLAVDTANAPVGIFILQLCGPQRRRWFPLEWFMQGVVGAFRLVG